MQVSMQRKLSRDVVAVVIVGLAPAVGVGIARFAYGLVLPDMRVSLGWSYSAAGLMNTINAAGYLIGALGAAAAIRRTGLFEALVYSAAVCVVAMAGSAATGNFAVLGVARLVAGIGGALAFVAGGVIATRMAQHHPARATMLIGLYYLGPGLGILISGLVTPVLLEQLGPGSWWIAWGVLAVISAAMTLPIVFVPPDGAMTNSAGAAKRLSVLPIAFILAGYFFFSLGSIGYMTFMIAFLHERGGGALVQSAFWSLIGIGGISAPFLWSGVIARLRGGRAIGLLTAITLVCVLVPLVVVHQVWLQFASALIFGGAFFGVVAATTAFVRKNYPQPLWPSAIGAMTVAFGLGQTLGPLVSGAVADFAGSIAAGLAVSAVLAGCGVVAAVVQRDLLVSPEAER